MRRVANLVARKRVTDSATPAPPALRGTQCLLHAFPWSSSPSPMGLFDISVSHSVCKQLFIPAVYPRGQERTEQPRVDHREVHGGNNSR